MDEELCNGKTAAAARVGEGCVSLEVSHVGLDAWVDGEADDGEDDCDDEAGEEDDDGEAGDEDNEDGGGVSLEVWYVWLDTWVDDEAGDEDNDGDDGDGDLSTLRPGKARSNSATALLPSRAACIVHLLMIGTRRMVLVFMVCLTRRMIFELVKI